MTWTTPRTWVAGETVTAAIMNTHIRDELNAAFPLGSVDSAWFTYTPTVTASTGTFTTVSGSGRYTQIAKTLFLHLDITITTNGTAAGNVLATLPSGITLAAFTSGYGRASGTSGKQLQAYINTTTQLRVNNYDNTYPGASGEVLRVDFIAETT